MGEPRKTEPLNGILGASAARHEIMRAVARTHPGALEAAREQAVANTQAKHNLPPGEARMLVESVIEAAIAAPDAPLNVTPFRKGRR